MLKETEHFCGCGGCGQEKVAKIVHCGLSHGYTQLDNGFDDSLFPHSVNINRAYFQALIAAGVKLKKISDGEQLSTCVTNVSEKVIPHRIESGQSFEIIATDGSVALATSDTVIHLKDTPTAARKCLGIGTWDTPAAQVAASFFVQAERMVFDPFKAQVWFSRKTN